MISRPAGVLFTDDDPNTLRASRLTALADVASMVEQGLSIEAAAAAVGIAVPDPEMLPSHFAFAPSPQRIAAECRAFQSTWDDGEYQSRVVGPRVQPWLPPSVAVDELGTG